MPNRLLFLRHASTPYNESRALVGGRSNHLPLSETGLGQPAVAARYFREKDLRPDQWISSPAVRTVTTGLLLLNELNMTLSPTLEPRIQEMSQGVAEGQPRALVWNKERSEAAVSGGMDFRLKGGESPRETTDRMVDFVREKSKEEDREENILVTCHGLSSAWMVGHYLGWDREEVLERVHEIKNCSLTSLLVARGEVVVEYFARDLLEEGALR